ncbi:MAG TPA: efflux RND transporter periplasmic adaptor subunit [Thiolapillus brandeum]|uniref:Efflux RND transporter periplasmic adaptor subunit n=1 Tax=Thiolapillus brandeum TaxID=1076588 RepID=A0A831KB97_9GAMM|nr:efflux RND transporter periplasmic adaptor subunit [Thiolapillus brandeum]
MNTKNHKLYLLLLALMYSTTGLASGDHDHENEPTIAQTEHADHDDADTDEHGHGEEENTVHLSDEQRQAAGIEVEALELHPLAEEIEAPGEVSLNAYATSQITPRIEAQVVKRFARLGDDITEGQPLVMLSSATMAEAQGALLIAAKEWHRVKKLGKQVVSEQRHLESRVAYQQAYSRLLAYGMTEKQANQLVNNSAIGKADGSFTIMSPQNGTVIRDDFIIGQMAQPGDLLFEITDESTIWVEARVNPGLMRQVHVGAPARILSSGKWISGKVIQIHHALDEVTRTMAVRLEIPNPGDHLHPGQFVTTRIETGQSDQTVLSLPTDAIMRSPDGDWQVFVEKEPGEYEPVEVEVIRQIPGLAVIDGLAPGTRVVIKGAFFIQSELAKSSFEVHNH